MDYQGLVDASKAYADRQDAEVSDNMDIFLVMAEARMNRVLKTREQSTRAYVLTVLDQEYYSLPPDYAGMRNIQLNSTTPNTPHSVSPYHYMAPEQMDHIRQKPYVNELYYTIIANQIQIYPCQSAGQTIELVYYQKVPPLTLTATNNWMSDSHPDIYLAGLCAEISSFVKDYTVAGQWDEKMTRSIDELKTSDTAEVWAGSQLTIRTI